MSSEVFKRALAILYTHKSPEVRNAATEAVGQAAKDQAASEVQVETSNAFAKQALRSAKRPAKFWIPPVDMAANS